MRRPAHGKVNLALSVGPPLPASHFGAGMHPIASWMHAIDLCDQIEVSALADGQPSSYAIAWAVDAPRPSAIDWPIEKDLAVRAHRLLEGHTGRSLPVDLRVVKRIPVGAGLGGGSSDAAAAMVAIDLLFKLEIPFAQLRDLSRALGSDVAFFIDERAGIGAPRPAVVTGLGDHVNRCPPSPGYAVLILPPFGCPTGPVYKAFDSLPSPGLHEGKVSAMSATRRPAEVPLFNALQGAAELVQPALRELRGRVAGLTDRRILMSGSGSTLFVVAQSEAEQAALSAKIRAAVPDVVVVGVRLV